MKPLTLIYWTRFGLGVISAFLCTLYGIYAKGENSGLSLFITGVLLAFLIYFASYHVFKAKYLLKVDKISKIFTTGIGIYFITWLVMWILLWTLLHPQPG